MALACNYIALHVPDLRAAEDFYRQAFGMELMFREAERDGEWWTVPADKGWEDTDAAGVAVGMIALRGGRLVLALFRGARGTVYEICLGTRFGQIDGRLAHVSDDVDVLERGSGFIRLEDPFGFRWVLQDSDAAFRSSGEIAGRWLEL